PPRAPAQAPAAPRPAAPIASRPMPRIETPAPAPAAPAARSEAEVVPASVMAEIRALRQIVEQHMAGFAWGETARNEPVKTELLRQMLDSGFSPQLARELLDDLPHELDARQAQAWARGAADRALRTLGSDHDIIERGGVFALVGPTGVGKTTTTAKLAARCVLRHGASKLALVTTDGYRIGAHEQLRIYGRILGVPVHLVKDGDDLRQTLAELSHKHMVLVDTMGMSQRDQMVTEQIGMLSACNVQRLLLLNATGRGDTMDDVVRAYRGGGLAGCILTKVDEAASLAPALDVAMRHGLKLHYVSNGQRVPEDLHLPNRAYLLHRAFKDAPESSPHRFAGVEPGLVMASAGVAAVGGRRG
ncbi:MAG: flagellar biosynthesis protein FlhF, partial [Rhodocyclaceae bacterium]|nr:flagellar biosynthesis protein FlhF [Rhodocyclaceae bacterium]